MANVSLLSHTLSSDDEEECLSSNQDSFQHKLRFYPRRIKYHINDTASDFTLIQSNEKCDIRLPILDQTRIVERLNFQTIVLVDLQKGEPCCTVRGLVRVASDSIPGRVIVRYTTDNWKTQKEAGAEFLRSCANSSTSQYHFLLDVSTLCDVGGWLEFALKYEVNEKEYWDNNNRSNYSVQVCKTEMRDQSDQHMGVGPTPRADLAWQVSPWTPKQTLNRENYSVKQVCNSQMQGRVLHRMEAICAIPPVEYARQENPWARTQALLPSPKSRTEKRSLPRQTRDDAIRLSDERMSSHTRVVQLRGRPPDETNLSQSEVGQFRGRPPDETDSSQTPAGSGRGTN